jgi:argininosuccinate lyase
MTGMVDDLKPDVARLEAAAGAGFSTATDLADWLVRALGVPFRQAHHVTGRVVALAAERNVGLEDLSLEDLRAIEPGITAEVFAVLGVRNSVTSRTSYGGTAPANVKAQAERWLGVL